MVLDRGLISDPGDFYTADSRSRYRQVALGILSGFLSSGITGLHRLSQNTFLKGLHASFLFKKETPDATLAVIRSTLIPRQSR